MKFRSALILLLVLISFKVYSQPTETIYLGNTIKSGYAINEAYGPYNIGFNFTFFGISYNQFYTNSNGMVTFGSSTTDNTEDPIPTTGTPNNYIAALWDELVVNSFGNILYATVGAAPNRKLIIQYRNMGFFGAPSYMGTFAVILYETSNKIQVQYRTIVLTTDSRAGGGSATIGIENSTGTIGAQYAYHDPLAISSGKAISFSYAGPNYNINDNELYEGVYLTSNITLPEPGITEMFNPADNSTIGTTVTFDWAPSANASVYSIELATNPSLVFSSSYNAGANLSYTLPGLLPETTYYWTLFITNSTGQTWNEVMSFTTSSSPPLSGVPRTIWAEHGQEKIIQLQYTGGDASAKTAIITSLPAQGQIYQYNAGVKGALISSVPTTLTDPNRNVIYVANGSSGNGAGNFNFKINDDTGDSPEALVTVNVSPPGIPSVLYIAKGTGVEIQFDRIMADPAGKHNQFTVNVNGTPATMSSAALKTGDPYTISLGLSPGLTGTETVLVSYTQGDITSAAGGFLLSFTDQSVTLRSQTINFTQTLDKKFNESPFNLTATASSGLGLTYSNSVLAVATISTNVVTLKATGTSNITARQAGNGTWAPAKYVRTMTVAKGEQTIVFSPLADKVYGDADFSLTAVAGSLLLVEYLSSNLAVATVEGNTVHIVGAGTTTITASQAGNANWNAAAEVPQSLTVNKAEQTITFGALPDKVYGEDDFSLTAVAGSLLLVEYVSSNLTVATVEGNTVHIVGAGTTKITASQAGDANWNAAPDVPQTLTVNKGDQTITFSPLVDKVFGEDDFTLTAVAGSLLLVEYLSSNLAVATVSGNTVHIVGAGTTTITASQAGDANWNAAADVAQTLTVSKADQTITFDALTDKVYGDADFTLTAVAGSLLLVEYLSSNLAVATVEGNTVHIVGAGTTTITASQAGDENWNAAPDVSQTLTVNNENKADQTIDFSPLADKVFGEDDFTLTAVAGSLLLVEFVSSNLTVATVSGNTVHIVGAGTTTITASQAGDDNWNAAPEVPQELTVNKADQTITFDALTDKVFGDADFTLTAVAGSLLLVEFVSSNLAVATVSGNIVTIVGAGTTIITASQGGDANWNAAPDVTQTLTIDMSQQVITINDLPEKLLVKDTYVLDATSTSSLPVQFESLDTDIATVSGMQLTGVSAGMVTIRAFHPGDENYYPAEATGTVEVYSTHKDIMHLFTPNNDGINDYWELPLSEWGKCEVRVFSRSGKLVFSNPDYDNRWDGTSDGGPLPEGAYYYVIKTELAGAVKGTVNVVR